MSALEEIVAFLAIVAVAVGMVVGVFVHKNATTVREARKFWRPAPTACCPCSEN